MERMQGWLPEREDEDDAFGFHQMNQSILDLQRTWWGWKRKEREGEKSRGVELGMERMQERLMETQGDTMNTEVRSNQNSNQFFIKNIWGFRLQLSFL